MEVPGPSLKSFAERYGVTEPEYHPKQMLNTETLMHMTQLRGYHFWAVHIVFLQCFVYLSSGWLLELLLETIHAIQYLKPLVS